MKILVIGDSHTQALKAASGGVPNMPETNIHWLNIGKGASAKHGDILREEADHAVRSLSPDDLLVIGFLGARHNALGLVEHELPFDTMLPGEEDTAIPEGVQLIPYAVLESMLSDELKDSHPTLGLVFSAPCRVFAIMAPPPKGDDEYIYEKISRKIGDCIVNPAPRRLRLWKIERDVVSKALRKRGVELLPTPKAALTSEGFLSREFWAGDAQHANENYGALVLRQIKELLQ